MIKLDENHILRDFEPGVGGRGSDSIKAICVLSDSSQTNSTFSAKKKNLDWYS